MKSLPNIEKSGFRKGEYVGYGAGKVWRIRKTNSTYSNWAAYARLPASPHWDSSVPTIFAFRLSDMSGKLAALKA